MIKTRKSECQNLVIIFKGDKLIVGEKYNECEDWGDWYFCEVQNHIKGRVPKQVIKWLSRNEGEALANYFAKEMSVEVGELLIGTQALNGWIWCQNFSSQEEGWVPLENLVQI